MRLKSGRTFSVWGLLIVIVIGVVLGEIITYLTAGVSALHWLSIGYRFGLTSPLVLDLNIMSLTFGIVINVNVASIIGMVISAFVYKYVFLR